MINRVHSATILVSDQQKAIDFYVNVLGWQVAMDNQMGPEMRYVSVTPGPGATEIALGAPGWYDETLSDAPNRNTGIALVANDLEATYAELVAKGVKFTNPPEMMPWGQLATWFFDLDDNKFFVVGEM